MLYQAVVKELVVLPNVGLVVSLYFVHNCAPREYDEALECCLARLQDRALRANLKKIKFL